MSTAAASADDIAFHGFHLHAPFLQVGDPGFQIYFLDDNGYGREEDRSFWVKGESRAEFPIGICASAVLEKL